MSDAVFLYVDFCLHISNFLKSKNRWIFMTEQNAGNSLSASKIGHMASQLMGILNEQLDWLKNSVTGEAFSEGRTKNALALSKGLQTLEELLQRMTIHDADKTPPTALEVRAKLEKQIAIIAERNTKAGSD
ncbi:MAG: hypothetical protein COC00_012700 [Rhizobiales bacterium]|nr:hypothetical protein [Hyphomicrobiales bacterium]